MTEFTRKSPITGRTNSMEIGISQSQEMALMSGAVSPSSLGLSQEEGVFLLSGATVECQVLLDKSIAQRVAAAMAQNRGQH